MGGKAGSASTSAWMRMYSSGPTPEIIKEDGTPRRGAGQRPVSEDGEMRLGQGRTCDRFPAVDDGQYGECISGKGAVFGRSKPAVRRTSFGMFVPQVLSQVSKDIAATHGSKQIQGADFEAKPGERCQRRQRIPVQRNKRLEGHDGTQNGPVLRRQGHSTSRAWLPRHRYITITNLTKVR